MLWLRLVLLKALQASRTGKARMSDAKVGPDNIKNAIFGGLEQLKREADCHAEHK